MFYPTELFASTAVQFALAPGDIIIHYFQFLFSKVREDYVNVEKKKLSKRKNAIILSQRSHLKTGTSHSISFVLNSNAYF